MLNHVFKEATDMSRAEPVLSTFYHSKIDDHQYQPFIYGVILTHLDSGRCLLQLETCNPFFLLHILHMVSINYVQLTILMSATMCNHYYLVTLHVLPKSFSISEKQAQ